MIKFDNTERGFRIGTFTDRFGTECRIQQSSAVEPAIWLGAKELKLRHFKAGQGWSDFPLPKNTIEEHVVGNECMHLSQDQVRELLPILQHFADFGELPTADEYEKLVAAAAPDPNMWSLDPEKSKNMQKW